MTVELLPPPVRAPELAAWNQSVPADWVLPSVGDVQIVQREQGIFLPPGHELLRQSVEEVDEQLLASGGLDRAIAKMTKGADIGQGRSLVGIAAPQVGEPYRLIAINLTPGEGHGLTYLYNPRIVDRSKAMYVDNESCFSCYKTSGRVLRHEWVTVAADNLDSPLTLRDMPGTRFNITARIAQHEIDHLDGIRIPDRIISDIRARRLGIHALWWIYAEHGSSFRSVPRANFPPDGKSPSIYHAQMLRTHQTNHAWPFTLSPEQWDAIRSGRIYIPTMSIPTR